MLKFSLVAHRGMTVMELLITLAIISILVVVAVPYYQLYIVKAQMSDAISLIDQQKQNSVLNIHKYNHCGSDNSAFQGAYGQVVTSGTLVQSALLNPTKLRKTGCVFTYQFNDTGVSKHLAGKRIVFDLFNNGVLSKTATSDVPVRFIPKSVKTLSEEAI